MISRADLVERANAWGLSETVVEKDWVLGWLLWGIGRHPEVSLFLVFKGGTCLKKCYFETYRFSEDLDFSLMSGNRFQDEDGRFRVAEIQRALNEVLAEVAERSGINFSVQPPLLKSRYDGRALEGRIYYLGPTGSTLVQKIKLDLSGTETVVRTPIRVEIRHPFPDELPPPRKVLAYTFEEVFAEKIRAMVERGRPRDLYDIINLFRHRQPQQDPADLQQVLSAKCASKGVAVPTRRWALSAAERVELESEWENMLGHQLPSLPPLHSYLDELQYLLRWLDNADYVEAALPEMPTTEETLDATWSPPGAVSTWGGIPIEKIRFAAANLLLVELGYKGSHRIVEPYSLKRSQDGNLLLYARRPEEHVVKAYRVDRIASAAVRRETFEPRYPVEFSPSGAIRARPTRRSQTTESGKGARPDDRGPRFRLSCPMCGRSFDRKRRDPKLRPHKDRSGRPCPGRQGYFV